MSWKSWAPTRTSSARRRSPVVKPDSLPARTRGAPRSAATASRCARSQARCICSTRKAASGSPTDMTRHPIQPDDVATPKAPYSPVVVSGDHVYTAGQVAFDAAGSIVGEDMETQARRALENLRSCLAAAGCALNAVVKVNAYLADLAGFAA